jgi:lipopolysaccharide transport system permease protein
VFGAAWAVLQPLLTMVVFSVVFGQVVGIPSEGVPYAVFAYAALLPWTVLAAGMQQASNSIVANANLISKVYFPRLLVPVAAVLVPVVDFAIAFVILLAMMLS